MDGAGFSAGDTVLHVHNHSLGKNVSLPGALDQLARDGYASLLHIHDFAEDFRPELYRRLLDTVAGGDSGQLCAALYPQAAHVHYAVLNGRDRQILRSAGAPAERLHSLPNPVAEFGEMRPRDEARERLLEQFPVIGKGRYILYPIRGIRRKNLGEALLWSAAAGGTVAIGVTKPPLNPVEQPSYRIWKNLAAELSLPVVFEVTNTGRVTFSDNVAAADAFVTTSVAEGFGMVFLEAWLAARPLIGRNLPEITEDYVDAGVNLDMLYERLAIPLEWVGRSAFIEGIQAGYRKVMADFGQPQPTEDALGVQIDALVEDGSVDFAYLPKGLQEQVVRSVANDAQRRAVLLELNPRMKEALAISRGGAANLVMDNAEAVRGSFSLKAAGRRLCQVYRTVSASPKDSGFSCLDEGQSLLSAFVGLRRLQLLRIEQ